MPRYQFDQNKLAKTGDDGKSCGAAASLVTLIELGKLPDTALTKKKALEIYGIIQKAPHDESPAGAVASFLAGEGVAVEVLINKSVTKNLIAWDPSGALDKAYKEHKLEIKGKGIKQKSINAYDAALLDDEGHLLLVCIIAGSTLSHYVLVRKDNGKIWVMNPDGGADQERKDTFINFLNTPGKNKDIGGVQYIFSGIAIHVKKS